MRLTGTPASRMSQIVLLSSGENRAIRGPPDRRHHCSPIRPVLQRSLEDTPDCGHYAPMGGSTSPGWRRQAAGVTMEVLFASVPVADLQAAMGWYEQLFGRPADIVPNKDEVMWGVSGNGWLYVIEEPDRARTDRNDDFRQRPGSVRRQSKESGD